MKMAKKTTGDIAFSEVLRHIASGSDFSCTVVELSEERKTGGDLKDYLNAQLLTAERYQKILTGRAMTDGEKTDKGLTEWDPSVSPDNPKFAWGIRHILTGPGFRDIRTIRPFLITIFNDKKVGR